MTRGVNASGSRAGPLRGDADAGTGSHAGIAVGDAITATDWCEDLRAELRHLGAFTALVGDATRCTEIAEEVGPACDVCNTAAKLALESGPGRRE